jgi:EmrB/QacA subfamily drug resistance transporter
VYATHDRRWWTLTVLCLSLVLIILGNTVLNVALPTLQRELDATATELQWMVDAYALVFAGLLLLGGALGDRFGRKGALQIGLAIFGLASIYATQAGSPVDLIAARALMGVGAALVMPATLSILTNVFPPHERAKAIAIWSGLAGSGAAIGPIAGGWLVEHISWGAVFWLNVIVVVIAGIGGFLLVPRSKDPDEAPLDPIGAVLSIAGLSALLYAIIEAPNHGWLDPMTLVGFALAVVLLAAFGIWELKSSHPMLDLQFFRNPRFSAASAIIAFTFMAMFGMFFVMTQYLQFVRGYTPLEAGIHTLPMALAMMVSAPISQRSVERFGPRLVVFGGMIAATVGLLGMSQLEADTPYLWLGIAFVIMGAGMGHVMPPATTSIMSSLPLGKAGVGSAVNDTTREVGGALGVAILGSLLASSFRASVDDVLPAGVPAEVREAARSSVGAAVTVAERIGGAPGELLAEVGRSAYVDGMGIALLVAAGIMFAGALSAWRFFPRTAEAHPQPPILPETAEVEGPEAPEPVRA